MRYTKVFTESITIDDSRLLFSGNMDAVVLEILNKNWQHKCYNGVYCVSFDKVLRRSKSIINNRSLNANADIAVEVEATIISYEYKDLIVGELEIITNDLYIFKSDIAHIQVDANDYYKSLKVSDKVPIVVDAVKFSVGKSKMSIRGVPFIKTPIEHFSIIDTEVDMTKYDNIFIEIKKIELEILEYKKTKQYVYFNKLNTTGKLKLETISSAKGNVSRKPFSGPFYDKGYNGTPIACKFITEYYIITYLKELYSMLTLLENYTEDDLKKYKHVLSISV